MALKTVLKVNVWCQKCQKKLLQSVCELQGVDKIEVNAEAGSLTVTGEADPCEIVERARKACKHAEVVNIGPPPPPQKEKKPDQSKPQAHCSDNCPTCRHIGVIQWEQLEQWDEPRFMCPIL